VPSLIAGGGSGLLFVYMSQDMVAHLFPARIMSSLLCLGMAFRLSKTQKFMPAGLVAVLSGAVVAHLMVSY